MPPDFYDHSLEEKTKVGETLATEAGLLENFVRTLLEYGASPHSINSEKESPLLLGNIGKIVVCNKDLKYFRICKQLNKRESTEINNLKTMLG